MSSVRSKALQMVMQLARMMEKNWDQLTVIDSEPQTATQRETSLVCLWAEQMAMQMGRMMESK
eukprot:scaffold7986_cov126-Skeletonema_dohrnii-CCMP3373.AAC.1